MDKNLIFYDIVYSAGGTEHICTASECEHFELKTNIENDVLSVYLEPKCSVEFKSFSIRIPRNISGKDRMLHVKMFLLLTQCATLFSGVILTAEYG